MINMARIITEQDFKSRMQNILEYMQALPATRVDEADPNGNDATMGGAQDMGGDSSMGDATMGDAMGGGAQDMGGDPSMDDAAMGDAQDMGGDQGVEGLNPQSNETMGDMDANMGDMEDMEDMGDAEEMEDGDEVIDVDALTGYQKRTAKGVGEVSDEIKALKDLILKFQDKVEANNQGLADLQQELEKRIPSQEEKINLRQKQSGPFNKTIEDYWNNDAPKNYSVEDDKDGEDNPRYEIRKSEVDGIDNWNDIARSFDDMAELNNLKNIFGF